MLLIVDLGNECNWSSWITGFSLNVQTLIRFGMWRHNFMNISYMVMHINLRGSARRVCLRRISYDAQTFFTATVIDRKIADNWLCFNSQLLFCKHTAKTGVTKKKHRYLWENGLVVKCYHTVFDYKNNKIKLFSAPQRMAVEPGDDVAPIFSIYIDVTHRRGNALHCVIGLCCIAQAYRRRYYAQRILKNP